MNNPIREFLDKAISEDSIKDLLRIEEQAIDILGELPYGYEYRLIKLSNASNSKTALVIAKKDK